MSQTDCLTVPTQTIWEGPHAPSGMSLSSGTSQFCCITQLNKTCLWVQFSTYCIVWRWSWQHQCASLIECNGIHNSWDFSHSPWPEKHPKIGIGVHLKTCWFEARPSKQLLVPLSTLYNDTSSEKQEIMNRSILILLKYVLDLAVTTWFLLLVQKTHLFAFHHCRKGQHTWMVATSGS